ncbi:hypothetical protein MG293_018749 [Ovis ammon polii]|uniref:Major facilitator superfamily (MFS) profile domain-containing protein n=1 Tax=Ovis ammon polii TaxID=230172 RepID=A0AAD4Y2E2_OVIAM|nr:hypothetical protein MG293_018749 [Ovis ammon polii]
MITQRVSLSIAIIAMVNSTQQPGLLNTSTERPLAFTFNHSNRSIREVNTAEVSVYEWSPETQGIIFSSINYGIILTLIPSGYLAGIFGAKQMLGAGLLISSLLTLFTPLTADFGVILVIVIRTVQGMAQGMAWTGQFTIWAKWAPPLERSKLTSIAGSGASFGSFIILCVGGLISQALGWPFIFYIFGSIGCVCCLLWFTVIYDDPLHHPCISIREKEHIVSSLAQQPFLVMHYNHNISTNVYQFCAPCQHQRREYASCTFMNILMSGVLSSLPFIAAASCTILGGQLADFLLSRNLLRLITVRKLFSSLGLLLPSLCAVALPFVASSYTTTIILLILIPGTSNLCDSGFIINTLDVAPRSKVAKHLQLLAGKAVEGESLKGEQVLNRSPSSDTKSAPVYDWNPQIQGIIFSAINYGMILTLAPSGYLAGRVGTKRVVGAALLGSSLLVLFTPLAADFGLVFLIATRILQGISLGLGYGGQFAIWERWSPPHERSRLCGIAVSGLLLGTCIAILLGGIISQTLGWPSVFYVFGNVPSSTFLLILPFVASNYIIAVSLLTLSCGLGLLCQPGVYINALDIAPRHSSFLMGASRAFAQISAVLAPTVSGFLLSQGIENKPFSKKKNNHNTIMQVDNQVSPRKVPYFCSVRYGIAVFLLLCNVIIMSQRVCMSLTMIAMVNSTEPHGLSNTSTKELQDNIKVSSSTLIKVPIKAMLKSTPLWVISLCNFAFFWSNTFLSIYTPIYIDYKLHVDVKENGLLSSLPHLFAWIFGVLAGYMADIFQTRNTFSLVTIRKLFTSLGLLLPSLFSLCLLYLSYNFYATIIFLILANSTGSFAMGGLMINVLDIAPRYYGFLRGVTNVIGLTGGLIASTVTGIILSEMHFLLVEGYSSPRPWGVTLSYFQRNAPAFSVWYTSDFGFIHCGFHCLVLSFDSSAQDSSSGCLDTSPIVILSLHPHGSGVLFCFEQITGYELNFCEDQAKGSLPRSNIHEVDKGS